MSSSIEPNSASELERILPLLPGGEPEEELRVKALLALASAEEQALAEAYEADAQALAAYAETQQGDHPIMLGFADAVMAQIATEAAAPTEEVEAPALASAEDTSRPRGQVLRPSFGGVQLLMAMAALFLGGLGLAILSSAEQPSVAPRGAGVVAEVSDPLTLPPVEAPLAPAIEGEQPVGEGLDADAEFSAPSRPGARSRRAPRGRRGIVPVDGRGRGGQQVNPLLDALMRGWQPPSRVPPLAEGEREVKF